MPRTLHGERPHGRVYRHAEAHVDDRLAGSVLLLITQSLKRREAADIFVQLLHREGHVAHGGHGKFHLHGAAVVERHGVERALRGVVHVQPQCVCHALHEAQGGEDKEFVFQIVAHADAAQFHGGIHAAPSAARGGGTRCGVLCIFYQHHRVAVVHARLPLLVKPTGNEAHRHRKQKPLPVGNKLVIASFNEG